MTFSVDVDEMHFGFAAIAADGVVGWGVDVPAFEVGGYVIPFHHRKAGVVVGGVAEGEGWTIAPVRPVAAYVAVIVVEGWEMVEGKAIGGGQSDSA